MNMKKTMAAVAACAVAVSAMATTVSAEEAAATTEAAPAAAAANTLTYDLVKEVKYRDGGSATYSISLANLPLTSGTTAVFSIYRSSLPTSVSLKDCTVTISGSNSGNANLAGKAFSFIYTGKKDSVNYSARVIKNTDNQLSVAIPVDDNAVTANLYSGMTNATIEVTVNHKIEKVETLNGELPNVYVDEMAGIMANGMEGTYASNYYGSWTASLNAARNLSTSTAVVKVFSSAAESTKKYPFVTSLNGYTADAAGGFNSSVYTTTAAGKYDANYNEIVNQNGVNNSVTYRLKENGVRDKVALADSYTWAQNNFVLGGLYVDQSIYSAQQPAYGTSGCYNNAVAVVNDILANYDDVTFTFNTATAPVYPLAAGGSGAYAPNDSDKESIYDSNHNKLYEVKPDKQYVAFGQHLYNLYGDENTTYVGYTDYDWSYTNLFAGALVINDSLSMSLSDTNAFEFSKSGISFNWQDITDGANVNTYVTYLSSMKLATSVDWYWESLSITYQNTEAEDIAPNAGMEGEEDTIEEEEVAEEEIVEEEEEVIEEEEEEEEVVEEEEAPAPAENPGTGNAPIALAVIPVALAAAAIVAKKRG